MMAKAVIQDLTSGSIEGTFEEAMTSVQNYGFSQSVFEVERLADPKASRRVSPRPGRSPSCAPARPTHSMR